MGKSEIHLNVYENRFELYQGERPEVYYQGFQNDKAKERYNRIIKALKGGYLENVMSQAGVADFSGLSEKDQALLRNLVGGITSEVGRALVGLVFLQLTIKSIAPDQSIRLHKGGSKKGAFSWVDGISMRTLDAKYNSPFLREHGLLNMNKFGIMMTRSLAENYPYSKLYKAEMRGAFDEWIEIVDALEEGSLRPLPGLMYLMSLLKNRSEHFRERAEEAVSLARQISGVSFEDVVKLLTQFFNTTDYSARAFEIVIHGFMQALVECGYSDDELVPLSQMRSANKKHGNVGDIELSDGHVIVEAWDAKYGKPYLRDELEELRDKILTADGIKVAGFIVDTEVDKRRDIAQRVEEIQLETGVEIKLLSFAEWIGYQTSGLSSQDMREIAGRWLLAVVESFCQRRLDVAPIDEPCDLWVDDLIKFMKGV